MLMASVYFGMHTLGGRILVDHERFCRVDIRKLQFWEVVDLKNRAITWVGGLFQVGKTSGEDFLINCSEGWRLGQWLEVGKVNFSVT